jgi:pyridoxamine 5'-phosphate oxidase
MDLSEIRKNYLLDHLDESDLAKSPFDQFKKWMEEAIHAQIDEPTAMVLATADAAGIPSTRTVLLKYFDVNGYVFFTNYESRKAKQMKVNPHVSVTFLWRELERQVNIEGVVDRTTPEESATYFALRPRKSQIAALASHQSQPIAAEELYRKYKEIDSLYEEKIIPLPPFWGGYRLYPQRFEFWQGRRNRLHDRFCYQQTKEHWNIQRLAP